MAHKQPIEELKLRKEGFGIFYFKKGYEKEVFLHHHDCYEIYLLLSGKITYLIEGRQYELQPGDCMMIAPGILHEPVIPYIKQTGSLQYERFVLRINKAFLEKADIPGLKLSAVFEHEPIRLQANVLSILKQLFYFLWEQENLSGFGAAEIKIGYVRQILIFLCRSLQQEGNIKYAESNPLINRVLHYIGSHLTQELSADQLAATFFVNKFYLLREFKKHIGTTLHHYIIKKRLILAEELLLEGRQVKSLYKECGFADSSNFFRCFKKEYGQTPRQFYAAKINKNI